MFEEYKDAIDRDAHEYYSENADFWAGEKLLILGKPLQRYDIDENGVHKLTFKDGDAETLLEALDSYVHDYSASEENIEEIKRLHNVVAEAMAAYAAAERADDEQGMEAAESTYEDTVCEEVQDFYRKFLEDEVSSEYAFYDKDFDATIREYYDNQWLDYHKDDTIDIETMTVYETKALKKN